MSTANAQTALKKLAAIEGNIHEYDAAGAENKRVLHSAGRAFLKGVANDLGLVDGTYDIRSNAGGIAVSGEVTLHADHLYIQLSESMTGPGVQALFRSCKSRKDYTGDRNHYVTAAALRDGAYSGFLAKCEVLMSAAADDLKAQRSHGMKI